ncbi:MAG: 2,3-epoxybenzoyl-CoA dihydrolase [Acidimicrobiia bacterium]
MATPITFDTHPDRYRHWKLSVEPPVATLSLDVDERGGLSDEYELKLNSYDLSVDIELYDAVQRLRFEHPEVRAVVITGGKDKIFCAGANIRMLAGSPHGAKVNFCKFTNETRCAIEDASAHSGQRWLAALNGTASGGGYELALATEEILLIDDGNSAVSLPEVPLLAVLPGTGGLTRVIDKRHVRPDRADIFSTLPEGIRGERAKAWGLVDEVVPRSRFAETVAERARAAAEGSDRPGDEAGVELTPLERTGTDSGFAYPNLRVELDPEESTATLTLLGPTEAPPPSRDAGWWPLAACRELDDALLLLRTNHPELGTLVLRTEGDPEVVAAVDEGLAARAREDWFIREVVLYWKRTLKRLELSSRSLIALIEPGSCFAGTLFELALCADRSYMLDGEDPEREGVPPASVILTGMNFGPLVRGNGLTRLQNRFLGHDDHVETLEGRTGKPVEAAEAAELGLVTATPDEIDWEDEVRLVIEERASYSPDALTGMEANLRFGGPETMETKIFGRLTAWQNWIFQRPNAAGEKGALRAYGTGARGQFDKNRV